MSTTRRQVNDALGQIPDNTDNEISPEDLRDAFLSSIPEFVQFQIPQGDLPQTVISAGLTPVIIDLTNVVENSDNWVPSGTTGFEYVGTVQVNIFGMFFFSIKGLSSNEVYEFTLLKNGSPMPVSIHQTQTGSASNRVTQIVMPIADVFDPNDVVTAQVVQLTGTDDFDVVAASGWIITRPV